MQTSRAWGTALGFCTQDGFLSHAVPSQARLRRQDVGLKPHLEQPDVCRPCGEAADSDSRPSSGSPRAPFPSPLLGPARVLSPPPTARRPSREAPLPRALEDATLLSWHLSVLRNPGECARVCSRREGLAREALLLTEEGSPAPRLSGRRPFRVCSGWAHREVAKSRSIRLKPV